MRKVMCNVLYEAILGVIYKGRISTQHALGYFGEEEDARKAVNLYLLALRNLGDKYNIKATGGFSIGTVLEPEDTPYYENIEQFIESDKLVKEFIKTDEERKSKELVDNI